MGSFYHILKSNQRVSMPSRLIFFDCESYEYQIKPDLSKHELKVGVACAITRYAKGKRVKEKWKTFYTIEEFWDFVFSIVHDKTKTWLIAHNQHFDFIITKGFPYLVSRGWSQSKPILDSNLFMVTFRKDGKTLKVIDSLNYFKFSIEQLGEQIGLPKLKIDFKTCSMKELVTYCKRDVEILKEIFLQWIRFLLEHNLGNFKQTVASQAFNAYRHRFMDHEIFIHAHKPAIRLERQSYRGGRVECFYIGELEGDLSVYDYNSLYPSIMISAELPVKLIKYSSNPSLIRIEDLIDDYCLIANVNITIDKPAIAIKGERLIFPIGTFDAVLTTPELRYVLTNGKINAIKEIAIYEKAVIFKRYIEELYGMRKQFKRNNNKIYDTMTKLLMNSLYGKFGQQNEVIKELGDAPINEAYCERVICHETKQKYLIYSYGGKRYAKFPYKEESRHSFVAIASHITAHARMILWHGIEQAGIDNVLYCDTDSLFLTEDGVKNVAHLIDENKLGYLKEELKADKVQIYGCKDYLIGTKRKIKGISKNAEHIAVNRYKQQRWFKFRSLLRAESLDAPLVKEQVKILRREYKKGKVKEDGKVAPYILG